MKFLLTCLLVLLSNQYCLNDTSSECTVSTGQIFQPNFHSSILQDNLEKEFFMLKNKTTKTNQTCHLVMEINYSLQVISITFNVVEKQKDDSKTRILLTTTVARRDDIPVKTIFEIFCLQDRCTTLFFTMYILSGRFDWLFSPTVNPIRLQSKFDRIIFKSTLIIKENFPSQTHSNHHRDGRDDSIECYRSMNDDIPYRCKAGICSAKLDFDDEFSCACGNKHFNFDFPQIQIAIQMTLEDKKPRQKLIYICDMDSCNGIQQIYFVELEIKTWYDVPKWLQWSFLDPNQTTSTTTKSPGTKFGSKTTSTTTTLSTSHRIRSTQITGKIRTISTPKNQAIGSSHYTSLIQQTWIWMSFIHFIILVLSI